MKLVKLPGDVNILYLNATPQEIRGIADKMDRMMQHHPEENKPHCRLDGGDCVLNIVIDYGGCRHQQCSQGWACENCHKCWSHCWCTTGWQEEKP